MRIMVLEKRKQNVKGVWSKKNEKTKQNLSEFVVCINNSDYPVSLELNKIYRVIADKDVEDEGDIRIIDESGDDYIYSSSYFVPIQVSQTVEESLPRAS